MSTAETMEREPAGSNAPVEPLPFERWSRVSARLLKRNLDERLDILEEEEIDPADWSRHDRHWAATLADDLDSGDETRIDAYAALCAEEIRSRKKGAPSSKADIQLAGSSPAEEAPASPVQVETPSEPVAAAPAPTPVFSATEAAVPEPAPVFSAPLPAPPAPLPAPSPPEPVPLAPLAAPVAPPPAIVGSLPKGDYTGTVLNAVLPIPGRALPFGDKPSGEVPPQSPKGAEARNSGMSGETLPADFDLKAFITPFEKQGAAGAAASGPSKGPGADPSNPTLPPNMTIDAYASLCAEMAVRPQQRAEVLRRYSIADEAALRALHERYRELFTKSPALEVEFQTKLKTFRDWLAKQR